MFRSLFVPLDGSDFSEHSLPFALGIAQRSGAAVQLLHVHVPSIPATGISALDRGADERAREREDAYLQRMARRWAPAAPGARLSTALLEGPVPEVLREHMAGPDSLAVMATHGRGPTSRFWLGSVADALVRTASVPLLLLRPGEEPPPVAPALPFRRVLIPLDGSELAEEALQPASQMSWLMGSALTLLRVVKPVVLLDPNLGWPAVTGIDEVLTRQVLDDAQAYLDRLARRLRGQERAVQARAVLHPYPTQAILEEAQEEGTDLIALATHGRGGFRRLLLGSAADKVLRGGKTPLLLCRP